MGECNIEEIFEAFYEKELQKTNQTEFRIKKVIKNCDKLYIKWKGYDSLFNSRIAEKDIIL